MGHPTHRSRMEWTGQWDKHYLPSLVMLVPLSRPFHVSNGTVGYGLSGGKWAVPLNLMANCKAQITCAQKHCDLSITLCHAYTHMLCEYNALYLYMYLLHVYFSLVNESLTCHPQCDSVTSCWGPSDTQCEGCRNFRYLRRCVQDCSVVSLPANSR